MYVSHLILYLRCKFHGYIPNDCQDIVNLLLGYFNSGHPVYIHGTSVLRIDRRTTYASHGKIVKLEKKQLSCIQIFIQSA